MIAVSSPRASGASTSPLPAGAMAAIDALDAVDARAAAVTAVTLPAPGRRGTRATLPAGLGPVVCWDDPVPDADGRVWSFAAAGDAWIVEGTGDARIDRVTEQAREVFASIASWTHPDAAFAPSVRLYGGVAFRPRTQSTTGPWARFQDASFTLPRWILGTSEDRAFLRICRRAGEPLDVETIARILERAPRGDAPHASVTASSLETTSFEAWRGMVESALEGIRSGALEKVVPATICKVTAESALDPAAALERLTALYPECTRFAFQRGDAVFLGASPERLLVKRGRTVVSDALAGSTPRPANATEADDADRGAALLASDKDRREHQAVVEAIAGVLTARGAELRVASVPGVRTLRNVHHLWTPIHATLTTPTPTHVLDLVRSLHPTPAVCGTPRGAAIAWIGEHEPDTRGWYAGAVGWFDAEGDGAFSVAIRSGVLSSREAWLYAGAGIVEGSDPTLEYAETRAKRAPMLAALGLAGSALAR